MRRQEPYKDWEWKMKLCLLAIGILTLGGISYRQEQKTDQINHINEEISENVKTESESFSDIKAEEVQQLTYQGKIRVLLLTDAFSECVHETVKLVSENEMKLYGQAGEELESVTELTLAWEEDCLILNDEILGEIPEYFSINNEVSLNGGTEAVKEKKTGTEISVPSIQRNNGTPVYEGVIEIWPVEGGFVLINELPLETYLNYVVPSEMPSGYEQEALKAQAVCARTYAYKHLQGYAYPEYKANVDDSVRFQVYNNTGTADSTSEAVKETKGQILTWQGQPITAYYFSTSCGYTGDEEVWWTGNREATPYLQGKTVNEKAQKLKLDRDEVFTEFIQQQDEECYDADISWYRWETEINTQALTENLNAVLAARYKANPEAILTKKGKNFVSKDVESIGKIQGMEVLERNSGGAIEKIQIRGSKEVIHVETEYNVRALLNVKGVDILRKDGSTVEGGSILPSACFTVEPTWEEDGTLAGFRFYGGGYGHGVGMSQNGANGMAKQGKNHEEILQFFYTDVDLTMI